MIVTKVTMNNTTVCMSNHAAAILSMFLTAAMAASSPEAYQKVADEVNEKFSMSINAMDAIAAIMQGERLLDRTITDLTAMVKKMYEAHDKEESDDLETLFGGKKNTKVQ